MKTLLITLFALSLAACGGGGSTSPGPGPVPTNQPTVYTAQIVFRGVLAGAQMQSDLRRPLSAVATPIPIMIAEPMTNQLNIGNCFGIGCSGGQVEAVVSPAPSSAPQTTFASTTSNVALVPTPSPAPNTSPAPQASGVVATQNIVGSASAINLQSAGTISATVGGSVNQTTTTAVYTYQAISLACVSIPAAHVAPAPGAGPAWAFVSGVWTQVATAAQADIYMSGPSCNMPGGFQTTEASDTLHFPYGGLVISTDTPFVNILASQWSNTVQSLNMATITTFNPDQSTNSTVIFKTASGQVVKIFGEGFGDGGNPDYTGAVDVSGASVDGF